MVFWLILRYHRCFSYVEVSNGILGISRIFWFKGYFGKLKSFVEVF